MSVVDHQGPLLTVHQVAHELGVSERTVRRRIWDGELRAVRLGGPHAPVRVHRHDLERWLYAPPTERPAA